MLPAAHDVRNVTSLPSSTQSGISWGRRVKRSKNAALPINGLQSVGKTDQRLCETFTNRGCWYSGEWAVALLARRLKTPDVISLDDKIPIELWSKVEDPKNLTEYQQKIIAEIQKRGIDF